MRAKNNWLLAITATGATALAATIAATANAQGSPGARGGDSSVLEEVLVTAQKREERLQDVPSAISAVAGADLQRNRVNDVYALAASVPSFNMTQDSAVSQLGLPFPGDLVEVWGPPRTYGVDFTYSLLIARHRRRPVDPRDEIKDVLTRMFAAWNGEDQKTYLTHYWRSEDMRWSMKGEWYKGWSSMEHEYDRDYPPGAMGIASISDVAVQMLEPDIGIAMYPWTHALPKATLRGCTTQILRKFGDRWLIVHEISARVPVA